MILLNTILAYTTINVSISQEQENERVLTLSNILKSYNRKYYVPKDRELFIELSAPPKLMKMIFIAAILIILISYSICLLSLEVVFLNSDTRQALAIIRGYIVELA